MKSIPLLSLVIALTILLGCQCQQAGLKACISGAFQSSCKTQLYQCFNNSDCSYQLHTNTQHIFLRDQDSSIPSIYFSNPLALRLHQCLRQQCGIGEIDSLYPATLPADYCVMEVWDACGGDVQEVYTNKAPSQVMKCYKGLCPALKKMHHD